MGKNKSLEEMLLEDTGGNYRCEFLALWGQIQAAKAKGYHTKKIWGVLKAHGMVRYSYQWFAKMVRQQLAREGTLPPKKGGNAPAPRAPIREPVNTSSRLVRPIQEDQPPQRAEHPKSSSLVRKPNVDELEFGRVNPDITLDALFGITPHE